MKLINLSKEFEKGNTVIRAVDDVNITLKKGKFYVIMGQSGAGKSTLIQLLGLLDSPTSGEIEIEGKSSSELNEKQSSVIRNKGIGFVFQSFYLSDTLNSVENIMLPMFINSSIPKTDRRNKAVSLLGMVGLQDRENHFPRELSGGEQQRVSIARALANDPDFILADEPTGNLDETNEKIVFEILKSISDSGKCVVIVTHNERAKNYADEIFYMTNGQIRRI